VSQAVRISRSLLAEVLDHVRREPQLECCGLLAGREGLITRIFPTTNAAGDAATSYEIAPVELFAMMRQVRAEGLELVGIYHSHTNAPNEPSPRDIERAYYPDVAYFIVSMKADPAAAVRAFSIRDGQVSELKIEIE
jgi:[CysO sulfur-carrier protein]-S-L-cysteine hydrolase